MVEVMGRRAGLSDKQTNRMVLAVDEMFANIARHGYHGYEGKVEMSACWHGDELSFELRDYAAPLSENEMRGWSTARGAHDEPLFAAEMPQADAGIKPGGLGMHLMRAVLDRIEHEALADGNRWRLVKYLRHPETNGELKS